MTKPPPAVLDAFGVKPTSESARTSRGFAGRVRMLELWDRLDDAQQDALLMLAGRMAAGNAPEPVQAPVQDRIPATDLAGALASLARARRQA